GPPKKRRNSTNEMTYSQPMTRAPSIMTDTARFLSPTSPAAIGARESARRPRAPRPRRRPPRDPGGAPRGTVRAAQASAAAGRSGGAPRGRRGSSTGRPRTLIAARFHARPHLAEVRLRRDLRFGDRPTDAAATEPR